MTLSNKLWFTIALLVLVILAFFGVAHANPSQFVSTTQTAAATSSPAYMNPGTGTSTVVYDTFSQATGNTYEANNLEFLLQFTASSTASQANINFEYSNGYSNGNAIDCAANQSGCDWYQDTAMNIVAGYATTSLPLNVAQIPQYQWKFASSTLGQQAPSASNNRDGRAIALTVPTRYVRAVITCAVGGAGCGAWGQFVPTKEVVAK